ncbi:hypothetical protein SAMIE_1015590 [Sphingobium amiense]|uniref:Lysis protein n=1 Tax=Sphingobium amiense TaxID=135719 RepID=A0A494W4G3_9SPHN|nr:hypothetical protein [Sphingobium amiense]BBD98058.1 hypothetical protein SAMIE_1015590 [Sphingobium amiense]
MIGRILDPIRPYFAAIALAAVVAGGLWVWRIDTLRASYKRQLGELRTEYAAFQTRIIDRTAEALRLDRARNAQVAAEQRAVIQETSNDYLKARDAELARLRERLRAIAPQANPGGGGAPGVPALPVLSTGPLRSGEAAIVDVADAEVCTENTLRLESLMAAWNAVAAIDPNERVPF